ncbi:MAG: hypothetical protein EBZ29_02720 [Synechococcaceae bacterium WB9_4xC_028]|nr:hypothetical protein [Synechococcaceae bacterium WB9_4xC_028]
MARFWTAALFLLILSGCGGGDQKASWRIFPLQRRQLHDGLAVVSQPDGYGLHLYLETDSSDPAFCRPRWLASPARLFNGNGTAPFSSGLADQEEFFAAVKRRDVRHALRRELEALCKARAPKARWQWQEPPRQASELKPVRLPALEEEDLLTDPALEQQREEALLHGGQPRS